MLLKHAPISLPVATRAAPVSVAQSTIKCPSPLEMPRPPPEVAVTSPSALPVAAPSLPRGSAQSASTIASASSRRPSASVLPT